MRVVPEQDALHATPLLTIQQLVVIISRTRLECTRSLVLETSVVLKRHETLFLPVPVAFPPYLPVHLTACVWSVLWL